MKLSSIVFTPPTSRVSLRCLLSRTACLSRLSDVSGAPESIARPMGASFHRYGQPGIRAHLTTADVQVEELGRCRRPAEPSAPGFRSVVMGRKSMTCGAIPGGPEGG